ncbi:universal stress protein [Streptomyces sp. NBC_01304]|uniref:universal stress protein n=1 Tax=Streptomyces sp. NBC_01304 TaxID=2903818 RepID=UPI002E149F38|nr:universal stress protein [Streptomyces sp. NBC_01304]
MNKVVVGVDGSEPSLRALAWAARQAKLTGATLEAVTCVDFPAEGWEPMAGWAPPPLRPEDLDPGELGRRILDNALAKVLDDEAAARVDHQVYVGGAVQGLLDRAEGAELLVVGERSHRGFAAALLGSVAHHLTHHAPCPVTVVRGGEDPASKDSD